MTALNQIWLTWALAVILITPTTIVMEYKHGLQYCMQSILSAIIMYTAYAWMAIGMFVIHPLVPEYWRLIITIVFMFVGGMPLVGLYEWVRNKMKKELIIKDGG